MISPSHHSVCQALSNPDQAAEAASAVAEAKGAWTDKGKDTERHGKSNRTRSTALTEELH